MYIYIHSIIILNRFNSLVLWCPLFFQSSSYVRHVRGLEPVPTRESLQRSMHGIQAWCPVVVIFVTCLLVKKAMVIPSGLQVYITMDNHHIEWVNQLWLW